MESWLKKYPDALAQDELLYTMFSVAVSDVMACKQSAMESWKNFME